MKRIGIIDDDQALRRSLQLQLEHEGFEVHSAADGSSGLWLVESVELDLLLLDLSLPDIDGLEVLSILRERKPELPVVMVTGKQDMAATIEAMQQGAFDYLRKPFELADIQLLAEKVAAHRKQRQFSGRTMIAQEAAGRHEIVGADKSIIEVIKQIGLLSRTRVTVLITGESGTGKELIARALHNAGTPNQPFIAINCSAIVPTLFESELFGHEKGAFTGADRQRCGKLEAAGEGTLFFDEIGDMPPDLQAKLLRVLQEHEFERVGGNQLLPFRARVMAATNRDLKSLVGEGKFREDLYFRISISPIWIKPLRERPGDIRLLVSFLIPRLSHELHAQVKEIDEEAVRKLESYDWPGNVRELENVLMRGIALTHGQILRASDLVLGRQEAESPAGEPGAIAPLWAAEKKHISTALDSTGWNISRTAAALEISPTTLRKKIADYGLRQAFR